MEERNVQQNELTIQDVARELLRDMLTKAAAYAEEHKIAASNGVVSLIEENPVAFAEKLANLALEAIVLADVAEEVKEGKLANELTEEDKRQLEEEAAKLLTTTAKIASTLNFLVNEGYEGLVEDIGNIATGILASRLEKIAEEEMEDEEDILLQLDDLHHIAELVLDGYTMGVGLIHLFDNTMEDDHEVGIAAAGLAKLAKTNVVLAAHNEDPDLAAYNLGVVIAFEEYVDKLDIPEEAKEDLRHASDLVHEEEFDEILEQFEEAFGAEDILSLATTIENYQG